MYKQKKLCARYEIKGDPISIAYGYDEEVSSGIFLSVYDKRLEYREYCIDEVNTIANKFGCDCGCGSYIDLHTGENGFGMKVSEAAIRIYLKRYGVPDEKIDSLPFKKCDICNNELIKFCDKCKIEYTPCRKSDAKDCYVHNFTPCYCEKDSKQKYIYGILLPEYSEKPVLVQIRIKKCLDEETKRYIYDADLKSFFGNSPTGFRYMTRNPVTKQSLPDVLMFRFRDAFLKDGSKLNYLIGKLTEYKYPPYWRGPVLILKAKRTNNDSDPIGSYINGGLDDLSNIIDLFLSFSKALTNLEK